MEITQETKARDKTKHDIDKLILMSRYVTPDPIGINL